jgi:hypothetical protein
MVYMNNISIVIIIDWIRHNIIISMGVYTQLNVDVIHSIPTFQPRLMIDWLIDGYGRVAAVGTSQLAAVM